MSRTFVLLVLVNFALAAEGKPESSSLATIIYEKAVANNCKDAEKAYATYREKLRLANEKILKALEIAKKDLNDPKKGDESISERAKALEELEKKIAGLNEGAVEAYVVSRASPDLLDLLGNPIVDPTSEAALVGKDWKFIHHLPSKFVLIRFEKDGKISFEKDGKYIAGQSLFENSWKITNKMLEILNRQGQIYQRYTWESEKWISTVDAIGKINQQRQEITLP